MLSIPQSNTNINQSDEALSKIQNIFSAGFATRECLDNGTWKPNLERNNTNGWTNFSNCLGPSRDPPPDISVLLP